MNTNETGLMNETAESRYEKAAALTKEKVTIHELINFDKGLDTPVKVSVVVPVCNVEKFLRECMDSCVNQTLKEIEIICVNDGSTDSCMDILREYAEQYDFVKVINKDNAGYGHAVNIGMDMARGEYIGIVESDDYVALNMYEELYNIAIEQGGVDMVKADHNRFVDVNGKRELTYIMAAYRAYYKKILHPKEEHEVFRFNMQTWSGIYRNQYIRDNLIRHNETPGASFQDNGFYFKTYCNADTVYFVDKPYYFYRFDNPNSSIHNKGKTDAVKLEFDLLHQYVDDFEKEEFEGVYYWKQFKSYLFTLDRIAQELKEEFYNFMVQEFRSNKEKGYYENSIFDNAEQTMLDWMLSDPDEYYDLRVKEKKISVIIPIYNVEPYLAECLESVISQTLTDIEIICINDGSTDKSWDVLMKYAKKDKRIKALNQKNIGVGATRNKGIDLAHGEFVIFMDPDDFYPDNEVLETLYNNAVNNNVKISGGSFSDFIDGKVNYEYKGTLKDYVFETDGVMKYADYQFDYGFHRFIYNTAMLREKQIYFPRLKRFQDPPFFISAMIAADEFYATTKVVYRYRRNSHPMVWTNEKLIHALTGLTDDLILSRDNGMVKLHSTTVQRVFLTYVGPICNLITKNNKELIAVLDNFMALIDESLIDPEIATKYEPGYIWKLIAFEQAKRIADSQKIIADKDKKIKEANASTNLSISFRDIDYMCTKQSEVIKKEFSSCTNELKKINNELRRVEDQNKQYMYELEHIRCSFSYKLGMFLTWLPRKIKKLFSKG